MSKEKKLKLNKSITTYEEQTLLRFGRIYNLLRVNYSIYSKENSRIFSTKELDSKVNGFSYYFFQEFDQINSSGKSFSKKYFLESQISFFSKYQKDNKQIKQNLALIKEHLIYIIFFQEQISNNKELTTPIFEILKEEEGTILSFLDEKFLKNNKQYLNEEILSPLVIELEKLKLESSSENSMKGSTSTKYIDDSVYIGHKERIVEDLSTLDNKILEDTNSTKLKEKKKKKTSIDDRVDLYNTISIEEIKTKTTENKKLTKQKKEIIDDHNIKESKEKTRRRLSEEDLKNNVIQIITGTKRYKHFRNLFKFEFEKLG